MAVRDSDSLYIFSRTMPLDFTRPFTLGEWVRVRNKADSVVGCYEVSRDLSLCEDVLDPDGNRRYAIEMKYGRPVIQRRCTCSLHRGRRDLPASEFVDGSDTCRSCQGILDHRKRGTSVAEPTRKPYWKRYRVDGRRRVAA